MSGEVYKPEQRVAESIRGSSFGEPEYRYKRKGRVLFAMKSVESIKCYQNDIIYGDEMTETQVLFRVDSDMLKELDSTLSSVGFKTRNEWFRNAIRNFLEDVERKKLLKRLESLKVDGLTDSEVAEMVRAWRNKESG
jgi:hypothetical protein